MNLVRRTLLSIVGLALVFFLFATAIDLSIVRMFGSPEPVKNLLNDSGIYDSLVSSNLDQAKQITNANVQVPLTDTLVMNAAQSTFNGQFLRTTSNQIIDSVYRWLDGKTTVPDFRIDLSAKKVEFADKVSAAIAQRAASLPPCTSVPASYNFDAFSATCLPPGVTPAVAGSTVRSDILSGQGFLDNPVITAASVKAQGSNQSIFQDQLKQTPEAYRNLKASPLVFGLISLLALLSVVFLSRPRMAGLKHAGFILLGVGIFVMLIALAINSAVNNKLLPNISFTNSVLQDDTRKLVHDSTHQVDNTLLWVGGGYAVLGILTAGSYFFIRHRRPAPETSPEHAAVDAEPSKPPVESAASKPKPKAPARKKIDVK